MQRLHVDRRGILVPRNLRDDLLGRQAPKRGRGRRRQPTTIHRPACVALQSPSPVPGLSSRTSGDKIASVRLLFLAATVGLSLALVAPGCGSDESGDAGGSKQDASSGGASTGGSSGGQGGATGGGGGTTGGAGGASAGSGGTSTGGIGRSGRRRRGSRLGRCCGRERLWSGGRERRGGRGGLTRCRCRERRRVVREHDVQSERGRRVLLQDFGRLPAATLPQRRNGGVRRQGRLPREPALLRGHFSGRQRGMHDDLQHAGAALPYGRRVRGWQGRPLLPGRRRVPVDDLQVDGVPVTR